MYNNESTSVKSNERSSYNTDKDAIIHDNMLNDMASESALKIIDDSIKQS